MSLDTQLQRTVGIVYGEIMKDSGISLPNGRYISRTNFVSELTDGRMGVRASRTEISRTIRDAIYYGDDDNILTGVQYLRCVVVHRKGSVPYDHPSTTYMFNPWKELMKDIYFGDPRFEDWHFKNRYRLFETVRQNPREGVSKLRDLYILFTDIPTSLQGHFLALLSYCPCDLMLAMRHRSKHPELESHVDAVVSRIVDAVEDKDRGRIRYVLKLLSLHNFCVTKAEIIRGQIEDLVGFDVETIPTHWEQGHLDPAVIAEKRAELNELLNEKRN